MKRHYYAGCLIAAAVGKQMRPMLFGFDVSQSEKKRSLSVGKIKQQNENDSKCHIYNASLFVIFGSFERLFFNLA